MTRRSGLEKEGWKRGREKSAVKSVEGIEGCEGVIADW